VILEEIRMMDTHPTADEIFERVRKRLPRISLGTVYRNLDVLSRLGMIRKLEVGGTQRRFDGNVTPHYHIRCLGCGKVEDLDLEPMKAIERSLGDRISYRILGHHLEVVGLCPQCSEDEGQKKG
jgi:Fur family ferric uptake transcriptional regulator